MFQWLDFSTKSPQNRGNLKKGPFLAYVCGYIEKGQNLPENRAFSIFCGLVYVFITFYVNFVIFC